MYERYILYCIDDCPYCEKAVSLLEGEGESFISVILEKDSDALKKIKEAYEQKTVPIILGYDGREDCYDPLGGYTDLQEIFEEDDEEEFVVIGGSGGVSYPESPEFALSTSSKSEKLSSVVVSELVSVSVSSPHPIVNKAKVSRFMPILRLEGAAEWRKGAHVGLPRVRVKQRPRLLRCGLR